MRNASIVLALALIVGWYPALLKGEQPATSHPASSYYTLGPDDEVSVAVVELPEFSARSYHVDADGTISLPLIGRIQAAGLTMARFEEELQTKLHSQVQNPHVVVSLVETRSVPVSVMGEVNNPGTQQLQGQRSLFDVLASAGGLKADAGDTVIITRQPDEGPLTVPGSTRDQATGRVTAAVRVHDVVDLKDPRANIAVRPHDEIYVGKAKVLYVIGDVKKAGGFPLSGRSTMPALEAVALAEGFAPNAKPSNARILRRDDSSANGRVQIPVNLKKIMAGKSRDVPLTADDILYVPDSNSRKIAARAAEAAVATISGIIIWRGL